MLNFTLITSFIFMFGYRLADQLKPYKVIEKVCEVYHKPDFCYIMGFDKGLKVKMIYDETYCNGLDEKIKCWILEEHIYEDKNLYIEKLNYFNKDYMNLVNYVLGFSCLFFLMIMITVVCIRYKRNNRIKKQE